jgi:hypothetical protein
MTHLPGRLLNDADEEIGAASVDFDFSGDLWQFLRSFALTQVEA